MSKLRLLCIVLPLVWLVACATPSKPKPKATAVGIVVLSVRLNEDDPRARPVTGLIVSVDNQNGPVGRQFAFVPTARVPASYTGFLVRLELPEGRYRLRGLTSVVEGVQTAEHVDVAVNMPFDARANTTDYIGRIDIRDEQVSGVADSYEDDFPNLVRAWPALRGRTLARRILVPDPASDTAAELVAAAVARPKGEYVATTRLDSTVARDLSAKAQIAFRSFLKVGYPRAFAVAESGHTGVATGGANVISRAIRNCERASGAKKGPSCRLFAVDNTVMSAVQWAK